MKKYSGIDLQYKATFNEFPPDDYTDGTKRILIDAYYDSEAKIQEMVNKTRYGGITKWED